MAEEKPEWKKAPTPVRFQPKTRERLKDYAEREGQSRNSIVERAVRQYLDELEAEDE